MKKKILLFSLLFSSFFAVAQVEFSDQNIIQQTETDKPRSVYSADLDGDGDMDVLSASLGDDKIAWYENNGNGNFGSPQVISIDAENATTVFAADIDNDGFIDVLSTSSSDNKIAWYKNIDGLGNFGFQQVITTNADGVISLFVADLDGDGDKDVLSADQGDDKIAWYENTDGLGSFGLEQIITLETENAYSVFAADLDSDGDIDVLSASLIDHKIAWYENLDGNGVFGPQQIVSTEFENTQCVFSSDLDGDGDMDILLTSQVDNKVAWYKNDGSGNFGNHIVISNELGGPLFVRTADFDNDGDLDIITAYFWGNKIVWQENIDGLGSFGDIQIITTLTKNPNSLFVSDLDNDGYVDLLSTSYQDDKVAWYKNIDGNGIFGLQQNISTASNGVRHTYASDLDGDGDMDVLSASEYDDKIAWYENIDGTGLFGRQQIITTDAEGAKVVLSIDLDGDGDNDVLSASSEDDKIAWYENVDGTGSFSSQKVITTEADGAISVFTKDIDGDGDIDILSASYLDHKIAWYENTDGIGTFSSQITIADNAEGAISVTAADIDGDGDQDVVSASIDDNKIAWYENTDGSGNFGTPKIININNNDGLVFIYSADIDGDGDEDVLSASLHDNKIAWYENTDGSGNFGTQKIISTEADYAQSVIAFDIDNDGDLDVLSASLEDDKISWYENVDGLGSFGIRQSISDTADGVRSIFATDLDGDSDLDILSVSHEDKVIWYENLSDIVDINEPTLFNFSIYPTPTEDVLNITSKTAISRVVIYDNLGQTVLETTGKSIDVSTLDQGIYFVKVIDKNGHAGVKKIVKK